eukprot:TRINITY_DN3147_c0_g1_i1.p1 TRINITY_DN3147_c0_g1~~TRINITY_DN3147_c0_g1_i1.p1  ORF type:complete len:270 (+),score=44.91 TRINITY_DN3147_c0_g1_i1:172-981(+)
MMHMFVGFLCFLSLAVGALCAPQPLNIAQWANQKALFIFAHPDDIEGTCGGTVALMAKFNVEVYYLIVTNGDKGCGVPFCANYTREQIASVRQQEQINAAAYLGIPASHITFLSYPDTMVTSFPEQQIRAELVDSIRTIQPNVIFSWFPVPRLDLVPSMWQDLGFHPDHQAVGALTLAAQFDSGVGLLWPELGPAHSAKQFYMVEFTDPTHYADISQALNQKIVAFSKHVSQVPSPSGMEAMLTMLAERVSNSTNVQGLTQAEAFKGYF